MIKIITIKDKRIKKTLIAPKILNHLLYSSGSFFFIKTTLRMSKNIIHTKIRRENDSSLSPQRVVIKL